MKRFAWTLILVGVIIIQSLVVPRWFPYSWAPHLLLDIALAVTILKGRSSGLLLAVVGGIVQDVMIGNYFGLHVVSYAAVSYALGSIHLTIYEEQWYASAGWIGLGAALVMLVQIGLLWIVQEPIILTTYIWNHGIPSIGIDALVGILVHKLVWRWEEKDEYMW